jgi:hypothetical protein
VRLTYDASYQVAEPSAFLLLRLQQALRRLEPSVNRIIQESSNVNPWQFPGATAYSVALQYPNLEDAAVDIGGYPPDTSHFAITLLIDLISTHGDDWFVFPSAAGLSRLDAARGDDDRHDFSKIYELAPQSSWNVATDSPAT